MEKRRHKEKNEFKELQVCYQYAEPTERPPLYLLEFFVLNRKVYYNGYLKLQHDQQKPNGHYYRCAEGRKIKGKNKGCVTGFVQVLCEPNQRRVRAKVYGTLTMKNPRSPLKCENCKDFHDFLETILNPKQPNEHAIVEANLIENLGKKVYPEKVFRILYVIDNVNEILNHYLETRRRVDENPHTTSCVPCQTNNNQAPLADTEEIKRIRELMSDHIRTAMDQIRTTPNVNTTTYLKPSREETKRLFLFDLFILFSFLVINGFNFFNITVSFLLIKWAFFKVFN